MFSSPKDAAKLSSRSAVGPQGYRFMTETKSYPYVTHLDIKFPPLNLIDVEALAKSVTDRWYNQTLCRVNDSVVRLGVMQGEYHWHRFRFIDRLREGALVDKADSDRTARHCTSHALAKM